MRYPVVTLCHVFRVNRSSYKYWKTVLENQTADGLYYAVRYLSYMVSVTVRPEQEASPKWQPEEATRWNAGLLVGFMKELGWSVASRRLTCTCEADI